MKAKHEFKNASDYEEYLYTFMAIQAMNSILKNEGATNTPEERDLLANECDGIARSMTMVLLDKPIAKVEINNTMIIGRSKQPAPEKKIDERKKIKEDVANMIASGSALFKQKAYHSALKQYESALALDPTNKYIADDIKRCNQWIKAIADLEKANQQDGKDFVPYHDKNLLKKEDNEFTTTFPPLD